MIIKETQKLIDTIYKKETEIINLSKQCCKESMEHSLSQGSYTGVKAYADGNVQIFYEKQGECAFMKKVLMKL